jgi:hypothetical protein
MSRLGDFGAPMEAPVEEDTFGYFGAEIRVNGDFSDADLADFLEAASEVDEESPSAMVVLKQFMRTAIHADDFDTFWDLARKNHQTMQDRMAVVYQIMEAIAARPTQRSTDSSGGPQRTAPSSTDDLSSRVLARLDGRPDLQVIVEDAQRALAAAG